MDREAFHVVLALDRYNSWVCALCHDSSPLTLAVRLRQVGEVLRDGWDVMSIEIVRVCVGGGLALVTYYVIPVWCGLVDWVLEELRNERC